MAANIFGVLFQFALFVLGFIVMMYLMMVIWAYGWLFIKKVYHSVKH